MGSNNYGYPTSQVQLVSSVQGEKFETRHSRLRYPECMSGFLEFVEFSGQLDSNAVAALSGLVLNIKPCVRKNGSRVVSPVYVNSSQGELELGMQIGQWFKTQAIELIVTEGQICESACAVAFLGASFKRTQATGRAVLHLNGDIGRGFDCARSTDMMPFKSYLMSVKGSQSGKALYNQALTYCRNSKGWELS
ncbi:MAG: hypothetical protein ACKO5X_05125 [Limnohabitans sp.]